MSIASTNRINDFVSSLSANELADLETRLAHDAVTNTKSARYTPDELLFWDSICVALSNMHLNSRPGGRDNIINSEQIGRAKFTECSTALHHYVMHACSARIDRTHKRAIYVEVLTCLIKWMNGHHYVAPASICEMIGALPQAVNRCYPGYVTARMLHMVVPRAEDEGRIRVV